MKKKEFLDWVLIELNTIKEKATTEEIDKLNFIFFKHYSYDACIYGQMTGDCVSIRAHELYPKSFGNISLSFESHSTFEDQDFSEGVYFTPLEKYLYMVKEDKHEEIIQYLKGEINNIILN